MRQNGVESRMYADDLKVWADFAKNQSAPQIQLAISALSNWSGEWQLPLANEKCVVLHLGRMNPGHSYHVSGTPIEAQETVRDLGFILDKQLRFSAHTDALCTKAKTASNMILRALRSKNPNILMKAYSVYIRSILESGSVVTNPSLGKDKKRFESVQGYFT